MREGQCHSFLLHLGTTRDAHHLSGREVCVGVEEERRGINVGNSFIEEIKGWGQFQ